MRVQSPLLKLFFSTTPQTSPHPGNGNGRPGLRSPPPPSHRAKQAERGPSVLRYTVRNTCPWVIGGSCWFVLLFSLCPVFAEFSFTCMVGLTNALEQDGFISGFMGFYIKMVTLSHLKLVHVIRNPYLTA